MSTASSSSQRIPQLPAAFLAPQECPPGRCRFPDTPLPPPSPNILAALDKCFLAHSRHAFDNQWADMLGGPDGGTLVVKARITQHALAGLSPVEIIAQINSPEERREVDGMLRQELGGAVGQSIMAGVNKGATSRAAFAFRFIVEMNVLQMINERSHTAIAFPTVLCLHDVLDPANLDGWNALLDVDEHIPFSVYPPAEDLTSFKVSLDALIGDGRIGGAGWEMPLVWSLQLETMRKGYWRVMVELASELFNSDDCVEAARSGLDDIESALPLLAHSLSFPHSFNDPKLLNTLVHSADLAAFSAFTSYRYTQRRLGNASIPPMVVENLPSSSAAVPSPSSSFRRTRAVPNDSKLFGAILRRVQPRICAPDRCSGRTPASINDDSAPDYARVEIAILALFEYWFRLAFSRAPPALGSEVAYLCGRALHSTQSLGCTEATDRVKMISVIGKVVRLKDTEKDFWRTNGSSVLGTALRSTYDQLVSLKVDTTSPSRFPCLCDLVNNVNKLERAVRNNRPLDPFSAQPVFQSASLITGVVHDEITRDVRSGKLRGECWRGSSWRTKMIPLLAFTGRNVRALVETVDYQEGFFARCLDLFTVNGSARILEECVEAATGRPQSSYYSFSVGHVIDLALDGEIIIAARHNMYREIADERFQEDNFSQAIQTYKICFALSTAASWSARINSAAARLRLADSGDQQQYTLAIQDCTMALYYNCPPAPRFKAYYRRGLALARLSLFEKAILDFEQALLIEPQNVLIKQELVAAKKSLPSQARR